MQRERALKGASPREEKRVFQGQAGPSALESGLHSETFLKLLVGRERMKFRAIMPFGSYQPFGNYPPSLADPPFGHRNPQRAGLCLSPAN